MLGIDRLAAQKVVKDLHRDFPPLDITENLIVPVMERIGKGFEAGRVALSQVYMSGRIGEDLIGFLLPADSSLLKHRPDIAIAVIDDFHMLGKRIVRSFLRSGGIDIKDYGTVGVKELVPQVIADDVKILMISTLMLPSALRVKELVQKLKEKNKGVKVVVGGAPFRLENRLWQEVEADAVGKTAADALPILKELTGDRL